MHTEAPIHSDKAIAAAANDADAVAVAEDVSAAADNVSAGCCVVGDKVGGVVVKFDTPSKARTHWQLI